MIYSHVNRDFYIEKLRRQVPFKMSNSHFHEHYEFYYLLEGDREYLIGDEVFKVTSGDVVLIPKGELHLTRLANNLAHERILINFTKFFYQNYVPISLRKDLFRLFEQKKFSIPIEDKEFFENILNKTILEYNKNDNYSKILIGSYLTELLIYLKRNLFGDHVESVNNKIEDEKILEALEYILDNFQKNIALEDIAGHVYLSKYHFSRKFKETTGFTFVQYLTFVRIKESIKLLVESDKPITEIAFECGFKDSNYFGDLFKKHIGMSPLKYRKNIKK